MTAMTSAPTPPRHDRRSDRHHSDPGPDRERPGRGWADWVGLAARLVLGGTLLVAGLLKVGSPGQTVLSVRAYRLLDWQLASVVGHVMPAVEILVGLALVTGLVTRWSALLGSALMVAFVIAICSAWARGLRIDCGCFGSGGLVEKPWAEVRRRYVIDLVRDLGLLALGIWLVVRPRSAWSLDSWMNPTPTTHETNRETTP